MFGLFAKRLDRWEARSLSRSIAEFIVAQNLTAKQLVLSAEVIFNNIVERTEFADHKITPEEVRTIFLQANHYLENHRNEIKTWLQFIQRRARQREELEKSGMDAPLLNDHRYREELLEYLEEDHFLDRVKWRKRGS